jgi:predicted outer membrane repeat protein
MCVTTPATPTPATIGRRRSCTLATLALLAGIGGADAAIITYGPATDPACNHYSLQGALNAAANLPGLDIIRVSAGTYPGVRVLVGDGEDVAIQGGWLSCSTPVANAGTTTLSGQGTGGTPGAVITHAGGGRLTLTDLSITQGVGSSGGAVYSGGFAPLSMRRVLLHGNQATVGAGLSVVGPNGMLKEVDLQGVGFVNNIATASGGGIYALNATVRIGGDQVNWFAGNWAQGTVIGQGGGAIFAQNSNILVTSLAPAQSPFMDGNLATQSGGGAITMVTTVTGDRYLTLMNRTGTGPLVLANNAAARGGAIHMQTGGGTGASYAYANLFNAILQDNDAGQGGALYLDAVGTSFVAQSNLSMQPSTVGAAGPPCPADLRCNRIEGSQSSSSIVSVNSGGTLGRSSFSLTRGHLTGNFSPNGSLIDGTGPVYIDNSVLANNAHSGSYLIGIVGHELRIWNSTIAGNMIGADQVLAVILVPGSMTVHNSIVYQPGKQTRIVGSSVPSNLRNLLVNPGHGIATVAGLNIMDNLAPSFVNPGQTNFQLQPGSQARNRWAPGGGVNVPTVDVTGGGRPADPPGTPTPYDFGAYEYGSIVDAMFVGTFEG